jgi:hypothetical protein
MLKSRQRRVKPQPVWSVTVAAILLLIVLLAAVGHSSVAFCCFVLIPIFLFSLVEIPPYDTEDKQECAYSFEEGSPTLLQRPPPSFA